MSLAGFLKENAEEVENIKFAPSKRFKDENGKPLEFELCCITSTEDEKLRKSCMKQVPIPTKRNQFRQETDSNEYLGKLAVRCTVYPDLHNAELQNSYGVMGAETLLKAMLLPGEFNALVEKLQEINGFDISFEELVDEAKN